MTFRIGSGFDVHAFEAGDHLVLCGVKIPYHQRFKAHSDGDVALHALIDALLSSLCLGDIGELFPDTELAFKDINSRLLLKEVHQIITNKKWKIKNLTITILAESPKLSPYKLLMRQTIAQDLHLEIDQVNVAATTTERLGFVGRKEGIAANATVLIEKLI